MGFVSTGESGSLGGDSVAVATMAFSSTPTTVSRMAGFLSISKCGKFKLSEMVGFTTATAEIELWLVVLTRAGGELGVVEATRPSKSPLEVPSLLVSRLKLEKSMGSAK